MVSWSSVLEVQIMNDEFLVRGENLYKTFKLPNGDITAVKDVSIKLEPGKFIGIYGVSGSGKTTLLNLLGLIDKPTSGKLFVGDDEISEMSDDQIRDLRNKYFGFLHQSFGLLNDFTVIENVELPLLIQNLTDEERLLTAKSKLDEVGLSDKLESFIYQISGGQQQRTALARALVSEPRVILADEPSGALDSVTGYRIIQMLRKISHGLDYTPCVVLVTHDDSYKQEFDVIYYMKDGQLTKG